MPSYKSYTRETYRESRERGNEVQTYRCVVCADYPHTERQKQTTPHTERQTPHTLVELFQQELASARTKHGSKKESEMQSEGDTMKTSISCGHRAGFDAFMTGYTFACYALNACTHIMSSQPTSLTPDALTQALGQWRNCLSNRGSTPIKIATSQFSRPSEPHKTLWQTLQHKTSINND